MSTSILAAVMLSAPVIAAPYCATEITPTELSKLTITSQTYRDDGANPPGDSGGGASVSTEIPEASIRVEVDSRSVRVVDLKTGSTTGIGQLNSGDDYSGWVAINPLGEGWLYVRGNQYGSAIRIERRDGQWTLAHNLRVRVRDTSALDRFARALLGMDSDQTKRDRLTGIASKTSRPVYSTALRAMLFLEDGEIFDRGHFRGIGRGPMRWYAGDVTSTPAALLVDPAARLFAYDGQTVAPVAGPPVGGGWLERPIQTTRTFLGSNGRVFEVRGDHVDALRLAELAPTDGRDIGWYHTVVLQGAEDLLFVGRHAIYAPHGDQLRPIWRPEPGERISGPANSNRLADGKLLITTGRESGATSPERHWLLTHCK